MVRHFVECSSLEVSLVFFFDYMEAMNVWEVFCRDEMPFPLHLIRGTC
jgi:hypothetical protein